MPGYFRSDALDSGSSALSSLPVRASSVISDINTGTEASSAESTAETSKKPLSQFDRWLTRCTFFLLGSCSVLAWSGILYTLPYVTKHFLDGYNAGNSLLGTYQTGKLVVQLFLLRFGTLSERWLHLGFLLGSVLCGAFGPSTLYGSFYARIILLHVLCFLLGSGNGFLQGSGSSIAAIMPVNQVVAYSAGQGFGLMFTVSLITALSYTIINIQVQDHVTKLVFIISAINFTVGLGCMLLTAVALRRPSVQGALEHAKTEQSARCLPLPVETPSQQRKVQNVKEKQAKETLEKELTRWQVLKEIRVPIACIFLTYFFTTNLFPRVGPTQWQTTNPPINRLVWLLGIVPFGDTFGRCLCSLSRKGFWFKKIILFPPKLLPCFTLARVAVYVPFFLSKHLTDNAVFNAFWFQVLEMITLSVSHGWVATVALLYSFDAVSNVRGKRFVGPLCVLSLIFGIVSGLYCALLYR